MGSGRGSQYLFAGVKLRSRSPGHLEGGPNPEQQPQKPECAPLRSSPASGRGMEAAPRLSHSVVLSERRQRLRCCGCCYCWQKAEKRGGRFTGGGCKGLGSLQSPPCGYAKAAHPSSSLLPLPLLPTSPWQPPPPSLGAGGSGTTRSSAAHLPVAMAAAAAGARRVEMRAPGVCNRPNRRVPGSCKERGRNILQVNATKFTFSIALSGHGPFMSISNFADVAFDNAYLAPPLCAEIEGILRRRLTFRSYSPEEWPR